MAFLDFLRKKREQDIDDIIDSGVNETVLEKNPNFSTFKQVSRDIESIVARQSVVNNKLEEFKFKNNAYFLTGCDSAAALPLQTDKVMRIQQNRNIAAFPECEWCLDEIADDFLHENEKGDFITLDINMDKSGMDEQKEKIIQNEFKKLVGLFRFRDNAFSYVKKFLIEGELAFENIINPDIPDLGIIGVRPLLNEYYQTLIDIKSGNRIGIFFDARKYADMMKQLISTSYFTSYQTFNNMVINQVGTFNFDDCIPMLWPQVTYISSGETTPDGSIILSLVEKCKQAYYQLALLQDAAVILRVTRAPERLLFNINTGNMTQKQAQEYIRTYGNRLKSRKVAMGPTAYRPGEKGELNTSQHPGIVSTYDPVGMLETYIFGRSNANDGSSIESIGSTASYEQIDDIKYFLKRFLKRFKVPWSRFETPKNTHEKADVITYEEYSFSRQQIRFQRRFALGIKKTFITHLKLRGIWEKYNLKESDLDINFVAPVLYDLYQIQKMMEARVAAYDTLTQSHDEFSKITAMRDILHMSEEEIKQNYDNLVKEGMMMKKIEWAQDQLGERGPLDDNLPVPLKGNDENAEGGPTEEEGNELDSGEAPEEPGGGEPPEGPGESPPEPPPGA
jgi:hypothetical protein